MNEKYPLKLHPQSNNENYLYSFSITKKYIIFEFSHKHLFFSDVGTMTLFFLLCQSFSFTQAKPSPQRALLGRGVVRPRPLPSPRTPGSSRPSSATNPTMESSSHKSDPLEDPTGTQPSQVRKYPLFVCLWVSECQHNVSMLY